ncbi:hypothetical protein CFC21_077564 [Triticum aestivum]|uniref:Vacuolar iron transporter n=4 Tax=Triticinae TaxID=1648030 RepID=A0A3B6MRC7_WHEAT|nr:hypothetical protein CFC21_077564 [Triticum aestivum]
MVKPVQDEENQRLLLDDHKEKHFTSGEVVRDIIIGVSDGLTVPFALAAGLSGADASSSLVLTAGLAEVAAGAISMGLGGLRLMWARTLVRYLAAKSDADHYYRELQREQDEIDTVPDTEAAEIADILSEYGLGPEEYGPVVTSLRNNPKAWLEFMMKFELGLEKPDPRRALTSAATIALAYVVGGMVPLSPYMFVASVDSAMMTSVVVTLAALLFFGYVKGRFTGNRPFLSAIQTAIIGALASSAAYGMAKAVQAI